MPDVTKADVVSVESYEVGTRSQKKTGVVIHTVFNLVQAGSGVADHLIPASAFGLNRITRSDNAILDNVAIVETVPSPDGSNLWLKDTLSEGPTDYIGTLRVTLEGY